MSCHSTHVGIAANRYAKEVTGLDAGQVSSIFHRAKNRNKDAPAPTAEEAPATLVRLRREALDDPRLDQSTAVSIGDRYAHAIEAVQRGQIPDGRTWAAMQETLLEAEVARQNLDFQISSAARFQRRNVEDVEAEFARWRREDDYEDIEAPDPAFRLDPDAYPCDKHTARALRKLGFENYLSQRMPVFVYGTPRNGQGNDRLMDGAIASRSEQAEAAGIAVYGANWGFPYANEAPGGEGVTRGDLVYLSDDQTGDSARNRLDGLEGFDSDRFSTSHYRRVLREVTYVDAEHGEQTTKAWVYLAGDWSQRKCTESERIDHGDWVKARNETDSRYRRGRGYAAWNDEDDYDADYEDDTGSGSYTGSYTVIKSSTTSGRSARGAASDSASVFAAAGLIDGYDDNPTDSVDAGDS